MSFQNDTLAHYSSYQEKDLVHTMQKLACLVIKAENSKLTVCCLALILIVI